MQLSARNQIPARVTGIHPGEAIANVELDANGVRLVASITVEAARQLGLAEGSQVVAVIKASDVIQAGYRRVRAANQAMISSAMPTTKETAARARWCPLCTLPTMKWMEFAAPAMYRIPAMMARMPRMTRTMASVLRPEERLDMLAEVI
jgi:molybdopterin-binding protein